MQYYKNEVRLKFTGWQKPPKTVDMTAFRDYPRNSLESAGVGYLDLVPDPSPKEQKILDSTRAGIDGEPDNEEAKKIVRKRALQVREARTLRRQK